MLLCHVVVKQKTLNKSMLSTCCAIGCTNRYRKGSEVKFYRFPSDSQRRNLWIQAIRRKDWEPNVHSRLCSDHFISSNYLLCIVTKAKVSMSSVVGYMLCMTMAPAIFIQRNHPGL